jgi:hypothetical protein
MRRSLLLTFAFALLLPVTSAFATDPFQSVGRYLGFGWGDGYHSQRTWPMSSGPCYNCAPATKQATAPAPALKQSQPKAEPVSPSDRPAAKTSMRRYPGR